VATDKRAPTGIALLSIGFALGAGVLLGGPVSEGAGNSARAIGPMLVSGTYPSVIIYILGPLVEA
jgi:glycerol uptake facilitator-like aquaporin